MRNAICCALYLSGVAPSKKGNVSRKLFWQTSVLPDVMADKAEVAKKNKTRRVCKDI
jgi:hypothetical protein